MKIILLIGDPKTSLAIVQRYPLQAIPETIEERRRRIGIDGPACIQTDPRQGSMRLGHRDREEPEDSILSHLGDLIDIVLASERRDTFPAIMLASSYVFFEKNMDRDEAIVVLPVDPYAESSISKQSRVCRNWLKATKPKSA